MLAVSGERWVESSEERDAERERVEKTRERDGAREDRDCRDNCTREDEICHQRATAEKRRPPREMRRGKDGERARGTGGVFDR